MGGHHELDALERGLVIRIEQPIDIGLRDVDAEHDDQHKNDKPGNAMTHAHASEWFTREAATQ